MPNSWPLRSRPFAQVQTSSPQSSHEPIEQTLAVTSTGLHEAPTDCIAYEFPFTERIRTFLRLETLFNKLEALIADESPLAHHQAILTLFDILEGGSRADLKADLLQELERQRQLLQPLRNNPSVDPERLDETLNQLVTAARALAAIGGRIGQPLRDNEWLMLIRSRSNIPGGVCQFDLPSFHAWQHEDAATRRTMLLQWALPIRPLEQALTVLMQFLRGSGQTSEQTATDGSFTQPLAGKAYQLARITLPRSTMAIPELTANKYMIWLRFNQVGDYRDMRTRAIPGQFQFTLQLCTF